jgi:hypothetical protein
MATLKLVLVLITKFTSERDQDKLKDYIWNCLLLGMAAPLYESPAILAAFYASGNDAYDALALANSNYDANVTPENLKIVKAKMALVVLWLRSYASQVQVIANLPANCTTREEAAINIGLSYLTAQKLTASKKGTPQIPSLTGKNIGIGTIEVAVTNTVDFNPSSINFIAVEVPETPVTIPPSPFIPPAVVVLTAGQLTVSSTVAVQTATISLN